MDNNEKKQYDFETVIRREDSGSMKWGELKAYGPVDDDVIPFSVADMEFKNPPEVVEGLKEFLDTSILGYAQPTQKYKMAVKGWMEKQFGWTIETDWIRDTPGVINAFFTAVRTFTKEGEGVMLMTPVYYPMYFAIERNNRVLVDNKLIYNNGRYEIDFEDFEEKAKNSNTKLLILCSPHNPSGRVWTLEELTRIGRICIDNDMIIVSDEIHSDLVMPGYHHTVFASVNEEFAQNSIVCTAPSKTFNLAGLQTSNVFIPNKELRERFFKEESCADGNPKCNILGLEGCRLAYEKCEGWLEECKKLIDHNRQLVVDFLAKEFPQIIVTPLEGTYLLWMNFRPLGIESHQLAEVLKSEAKLFFDEGFIFGEQGDGFERWNLACPTYYIEKALERLKVTLNRHKIPSMEDQIC